jgi:hypothetical protein
VRHARESGSPPVSCVVSLVEERKVTSVPLGWLGPQGDGEMVFQPHVVKVEKLVVPRGTSLRGVQLQPLEGLSGDVEASGVRRLDGGENLWQPSPRSGEEV